jgi:hypothetical protein
MIVAGKRTKSWLARRAVRHAAAAVLSGLLMMATGAAQSQSEQVQVKRPAELRDGPGESARSLASLAVQTQVTRLGERQGPWIKVSTGAAPGTVGWLHMFDVGAPNTPAQGGNVASSALRGLTGLFNKGSGRQANLATSTVGIRGLGSEDIANAQPNPAAVSQVEAMRVDAGHASQFALGASLSPQAVDALPVPAPPRTVPSQNFNNQGNTP